MRLLYHKYAPVKLGRKGGKLKRSTAICFVHALRNNTHQMLVRHPIVNIFKHIILMSVFINVGSTTGILQTIISPFVSMFEHLNEGTYLLCCKCHHVDKLEAFTVLHNKLKGLYGQHVAEKEILKSILPYFEQPNPTHYSLFGGESGMDPSNHDHKRVKPLGIVMYGLSGTGKSFASKLIAESIYKLGMMSPLVHIFRAPLDVDPHNYKMDLVKWIKGNQTLCENSMFIFDECEKWQHDIIREIKSLLQPCYLNTIDPFACATSKGIFLFLTHTGGTEIVQFLLEKYKEGVDREDIDTEDFKNAIDISIFTHTDQMWSMKKVLEFLWPVNKILDGVWFFSEKDVDDEKKELQDDSIDVYIPFMPLEKKHVRRCIVDYLIDQEKRYPSDSMINEVLKYLDFRPEGNKIFTSTGCKRVHSLFINALAEKHKTWKHDEL